MSEHVAVHQQSRPTDRCLWRRQLPAKRRRRGWLTITGCLLILVAMPIRASAGTGSTQLADTGTEMSLQVDPKRIYIANDDHTDYYWTGDAEQYRNAFQVMLDYYMDQAEETAGNPPHTQGKFNCDGSLWVWEYEHHRTPEEFDRLIGHLESGTITMPLNVLILLYGAMPAEAVVRNMYYAGTLERRYGLRFPLVVPMENQTLPGGVASLWAGAGARYAWKGICNCATRIQAAIRPREIYHFRGPDGQDICMKWNSQRVSLYGVGGYAEAFDPFGVVEYLDTDPAFLQAWPWPVSAAFGHGMDALQTTTDDFIVAAETLSNAERHVLVSNEVDFFEDFLAEFGGEIPVYSGCFGNEWDLYTASMARTSADFKNRVEMLRTAEALASVVSLFVPGFMSGRESARERAFLACGLFYEHDWTADSPIIPESARIQFQRDTLTELATYVDALQQDALSAFGGLVRQIGGTERHAVFNPLSWPRTDFADLDYEMTPPFHVVDLWTGDEVRSQVVHGPEGQRLRILARDVPAVGYRVFELRPGEGEMFTPSATVALPVVDNQLYEVTIGPRGNITSLVDHTHQDWQVVDTAGGGSIHDLGSGNGVAVLEEQGPVSTTVMVEPLGASPSQATRITVYHPSINRIDVETQITENFATNEEFVSTFNLDSPEMIHEEVGMIAQVGRLADGGDYADENTRTDYLTFNHFVTIVDVDHGVTVSNWDSQFFRAGNSTIDALDPSPSSISAVAGMQVDGPTLGISGQGGDTAFRFRFALRTEVAGTEMHRPMAFALEHQNPLVSQRVSGGTTAPLPEVSWSLLQIDSPRTILWALKPAEEGVEHGLIARVWNVADTPSELTLSMPPVPLTSATRTTHIETDLEPVPLQGETLIEVLDSQSMQTYRLVGSSVDVPEAPPPTSTERIRIAPNPMTHATGGAIGYLVLTPGPVSLKVFSASGRLVRTLLDAPRLSGWHEITWHGLDDRGRAVANGVYFVSLTTPAGDISRRLLLLQ
jgi:alpha-mannosidase